MRVLLVTSVLDAVLVAALVLLQRPDQAWLLYVLLAAQFSATAFYDPARKAILPLTVPKAQLHLATTIDRLVEWLVCLVGCWVVQGPAAGLKEGESGGAQGLARAPFPQARILCMQRGNGTHRLALQPLTCAWPRRPLH